MKYNFGFNPQNFLMLRPAIPSLKLRVTCALFRLCRSFSEGNLKTRTAPFSLSSFIARQRNPESEFHTKTIPYQNKLACNQNASSLSCNFLDKSRIETPTIIVVSHRTSDCDKIVEAKFPPKICNDWNSGRLVH